MIDLQTDSDGITRVLYTNPNIAAGVCVFVRFPLNNEDLIKHAFNTLCDRIVNLPATRVIANETPMLKHGDVFTIAGDEPMVKGKKFICVPPNYDSRSLVKIWRKKIEGAA